MDSAGLFHFMALFSAFCRLLEMNAFISFTSWIFRGLTSNGVSKYGQVSTIGRKLKCYDCIFCVKLYCMFFLFKWFFFCQLIYINNCSEQINILGYHFHTHSFTHVKQLKHIQLNVIIELLNIVVTIWLLCLLCRFNSSKCRIYQA